MMTIQDICISPLTYKLLFENGKMDRKANIPQETGWAEIAKAEGYSLYERTPAREAYLDGYYS